MSRAPAPLPSPALPPPTPGPDARSDPAPLRPQSLRNTLMPALTPLLSAPQSLRNSSYNHFAAIYYLLLERLKDHRPTPPAARPSPARPQRPRSSDLSSCEVGDPAPSRALPWMVRPAPARNPLPGRAREPDAEHTGPRATSPAS